MAFAGVAAEVAAMTATVAAAISALGIGGADRRKLARQQGAAREQQAESSYMANSGAASSSRKVRSRRRGVSNGWGKTKFIGRSFAEVGGCAA